MDYSLDDARQVTQALEDGVTATETFTIYLLDEQGLPGSTDAVFTIQGSNDTPSITASAASTGLLEASGDRNTSSGIATSTINITMEDLESTPSFDATWLLDNGWSTSDGGLTYALAGRYGTATLTLASGDLAYLLDNDAVSTESLTDVDTVQDTFTLQANDGS